MTKSSCSRPNLLSAEERKNIAINGLTKTVKVITLAGQHKVSRQLVYRQINKAHAALDKEFSTAEVDDANKVIFMLPVTGQWLNQVMLALTQIARASFRGVSEFMDDVLGVSVSPSTVHNLHRWAAQQAACINGSIDLSGIHVG